jgi:hypothetical protein
MLSVLMLLNNFDYTKVSMAQMGRDHNMPSGTLGDRKVLLIFKSEPSQLISGKNVGFNFNLKDNDTGNKMLHVTYLVTIIEEGQRLFTETVHAHDGNMKLLFVSDGTNPHRMNANLMGFQHATSRSSGAR